MDERVFVLPEAVEMERRLCEVFEDGDTRSRLVPKFLQYAGTEKIAGEVVMLTTLAFHDYTRGMPAMMTAVLHLKVPAIFEALIDDEDIRQAALAEWKEAYTPRVDSTP